MRRIIRILFGGVATLAPLAANTTAKSTADPIAPPDLVFEEVDGLVAFEAEHFIKQELTDVRAWHITTSEIQPSLAPDPDELHLAGASGGAYVEILPDTRWTHDEPLIAGENFSNEPGKLAVLSYKVQFNNPGRYHVWARIISTGSEDNGMHFGLDGAWPESGQRWQTVKKHAWQWDSRQRTEEVHVGVPGQLFLDVETPGVHTIQLSMREDGTEVDRILLTRDADYEPTGVGPAARIKSGQLPQSFPVVAAAEAERKVVEPRGENGDGSVTISGELKQWHKVTLDLAGPFAHEQDEAPNPFTDYRFFVIFTHESGAPVYSVPGYFAADGNAAETSAVSGHMWRAHFAPDKIGTWSYRVSFVQGDMAAVEPAIGTPVAPYDGATGTFAIARTDKTGRDLRGKGRLQYVGGRYLQFAGTGEFFLKAGADAPETFFAYEDFDGTERGRKQPSRPGEAEPTQTLKTWAPHVQDWKPGDPTWQGGKGKGIIGAINYLAGKGANSFSFLTYNAGGDGDNVWPFTGRHQKFHYDCSKLDQWGIVMDHAQKLGLYLHFKLQENELDDNRAGHARTPKIIPESLDGGLLGPERKLYFREIIARFGHELALNWNLGEENTQSYEEQRDMAAYINLLDPYDHHIVIHTFPDQQDEVYQRLLGTQSALTGASAQNHWSVAHQQTLRWIRASEQAGRPWVVANDEQNPAGLGVPPDPGYEGFSGTTEPDREGRAYSLHDIRKYTLWGNLMAGGAGVEYYFGYKLPQNDLLCEDLRSRAKSWDYCRIALEFFRDNAIPFWQMRNRNELIGNPQNDNSRYCFAQEGRLYLVYLPEGGTGNLDLTGAEGTFRVQWFNPREGGKLVNGSVRRVNGGGAVSLGYPPSDAAEDWLVVIRQ